MTWLETLKRDNIVSEGYITGLFWSNPDNYSFYSEDKINYDNFLNNIYGYYFVLGRKLSDKNIRKFDDISVMQTVVESGTQKQYEKYGGFETVRELMNETKGKEDNTEAYYDEIKKTTMIKNLVDMVGEKAVTKDGKYDYKKMTKEQIHTYWSDRINKLAIDGDNKYDEHFLLSGLEDEMDNWDTNPDTGLPFYQSEKMTKICTGWDYGNLYMLGGFGGAGKAQSLDSNILTPSGYIKMRDTKIGDEIFGEDGKIHKITGVFPQGKKDMYEVVFSDGSKTITCDEHLWNVQNPTKREKGENEFKTLTLREIMDEGLYKIYNKKTYKTWMQYIPMTKPLEFKSDEELVIKPYTLGLLIGDGCLVGSSVTITINNNEEDLVSYLDNYCHENDLRLVIADKRSGSTDYRFTRIDNTKKNKLKSELIELDLYNKLSNSKFIPKKYLFSSVQNRVELLSGLIDSDGEIDRSSYVYSTASKQLSKDVQFLVQSLGGTAKISQRQTSYTYNEEKKNGQISYRLNIKMPKDICAFKSQKHKNKFKKGQTEARRTIREVNYIGKMDAQCIKTSNPTQLYLTDEMIVTHNTSFSFNKVVMSCIENKEKLLVIANEQSVADFKKLLYVTAMGTGTKSSIQRQRLNEGVFTDDEKDKLKKAAKWVKDLCDGDESLITFVFMENYIIEDVKKLIRHYAARGIKRVMIDTGKPSEGHTSNAPRWEIMTDDFKELYKLCRPNGGGLNLAMWVNVQLSDAALTRRFLNEHALGESKKIKNEASVMFMIRFVWDDELAGAKHALKVTRYVPDTFMGGYKEEEFELERGEPWLLLFTSKSRRGQDNKTGQRVLVMKPNFNSNTYKEVGWTTVYDDRNY